MPDANRLCHSNLEIVRGAHAHARLVCALGPKKHASKRTQEVETTGLSLVTTRGNERKQLKDSPIERSSMVPVATAGSSGV